MNYADIKKLALAKKVKITDLIALAPQNDPFYVGTDSQHKVAQWFTDLWQRFKYADNVHLRRIHYQIISQENPILLPNGTPYTNTLNCWAELTMASKAARYLSLVDPLAFDDRRNGKPLVFAETWGGGPFLDVNENFDWYDLTLPDFPNLPAYDLKCFDGTQRYHLELWAEKSTMNDILQPLCQEHQINLVTGLGELSITHVTWFMERLKQCQKPCRIFYISDFDPAGQSMPVAVARKMEKFLHDADYNFDVRLSPVVLSQDQCLKYKLPRTPIKETERRASAFEIRFGAGATELDALEALYPGELRKIIMQAISPYRDSDLKWRVTEARNTLQNKMEAIETSIIGKYSDSIDELRNEYEIIEAEFQEQISALQSRVESLWQAIRDDLTANMPAIENYPVPGASHADETDEPLYDSGRSYLEQLKYYKNFQGKGD